MPEPLGRDVVDRYLAALGARRRPPSAGALAELVAAHVTAVPFENVSKLHRLRRLGLRGIPPIEVFLDGIERQRLGGTCYANACHLAALLSALGYDATLRGADMRQPDVHAVVAVRVDGRELLVDAGYGAPFLDPMPLDAPEDQVIALGRERWVLKPRDAAGRSRLELHRDGRVVHGYVAKPAPRRAEDFAAAVAESFAPSATFMNSVVIARFWRGRSVVVHNLELVESDGTRWAARTLRDRDELVRVAEDRFGIPADVVADAVADLGSLRDAWAPELQQG